MGRPLRAVYANTTYSNGVIEMTNSELLATTVPLILGEFYAQASSEAVLNLVGGAGFVSRGVGYDYRSAAVGDHPTSNTLINTYTIYQSEANLSANLSSIPTTARPVQQTVVNGEVQISAMSDSDLLTYIAPLVTSTMIAGDQGAYYLGLTSGGAPVGGTWAAQATLNDTYYVNSTLTTDEYTLWKRTTVSTASTGDYRPLRHDAQGNLIEMTDTEVKALYVAVSEYIRQQQIGQYRFQTTAPATGTWVSRGAFTDTRNLLSDVSYTGYYAQGFTGSFTGQYSGSYTSAFSGNYTGNFTGVYTGVYANTFTGVYTGAFSGLYTSLFTGVYSQAFSGSYAGSYTGLYTGYYAGSRARAYQNPYTGAYYTGYYGANYAGTYGSSDTAYTGTYAGSRAISYQGLDGTWYTGVYATNYSGAYVAGSYTGLYTGDYTRAFTGQYASGFTGTYSTTFTGVFNNTFSAPYTSVYNNTFTGSYSQAFTGLYTGTYSQVFTGTFSGAYSGLTSQSSTSTTSYTLWVRTA